MEGIWGVGEENEVDGDLWGGGGIGVGGDLRGGIYGVGGVNRG